MLRASQSGVVTAVKFEVGQVVAEGQPVVSIANEGEPEIVVDVPEDQLAAFKSARYKASLASAPDELFDVTLRELSPQAAAQTRTYRARLKPVDAARAAARRDRHALRRARSRRRRSVAAHPGRGDHAGQRTARAVGRAPRRGRSGRHGEPRSRRRCTAIATTRCSSRVRPAGELVVTAGVQKMAPGLQRRALAARAQDAPLRQAAR